MTSLTKSASGADGVTITTANSGLDVVTIGTGAAAVYATNEWKWSTGTTSAQSSGGVSSQVMALWPSGMTTHYGSVYFTVDALPSGTRIIHKLTNDLVSVDRMTIVMLTTGAIRLRNAAAGTVATFATTCSTATRYRVDYRSDGSATGPWEMHLFLDDATTPLESLVGGTANFGGAIGGVFSGFMTSQASFAGIRTNHLRVNDTGLPGPFAGTSTTASGSTATDGTAVAIGVTDAAGSTSSSGTAISAGQATATGSTATGGTAQVGGDTTATGTTSSSGQADSAGTTTASGSTTSDGTADASAGGSGTASGSTTSAGTAVAAGVTTASGVTVSELADMAVAAATTALGATISSGTATVATGLRAAHHRITNTTRVGRITATTPGARVDRTAP